MKKILSISLLLFILTNLAGLYVYFYFRLGQIRKEMKMALKNYPGELQKISLSYEQWGNAKKEKHELEWRSEMYDVTEIEFYQDSVVVLVLRDKAETDLLTLLNTVVSSAFQDNQAPPAVLVQFMFLVFTMPANHVVNSNGHQLLQTHCTFYMVHFYQTFPENTSPPPEV